MEPEAATEDVTSFQGHVLFPRGRGTGEGGHHRDTKTTNRMTL
jgi:hypothetical protein